MDVVCMYMCAHTAYTFDFEVLATFILSWRHTTVIYIHNGLSVPVLTMRHCRTTVSTHGHPSDISEEEL